MTSIKIWRIITLRFCEVDFNHSCKKISKTNGPICFLLHFSACNLIQLTRNYGPFRPQSKRIFFCPWSWLPISKNSKFNPLQLLLTIDIKLAHKSGKDQIYLKLVILNFVFAQWKLVFCIECQFFHSPHSLGFVYEPHLSLYPT